MPKTRYKAVGVTVDEDYRVLQERLKEMGYSSSSEPFRAILRCGIRVKP
ncbi:MAG: hypothetical protein QXO94_03700 [Candidatus Bathyarchaeia archaeon]